MNPFEENKSEGLTVFISSPSKSDISNLGKNIAKKAREEGDDMLNLYIKAKSLEELSKSIISDVKKDAMDEAERLDKGSKYMGCTVSVKGSANRYSFEHNEEWLMLNDKMAEIKERMKQIESDMVSAMNYAELTDKDGIVIPPAEVVSYGGSVLSVSLPK